MATSIARGFTLIELLVVVAIAAMLAAFGLPEIKDMIVAGTIRSASSEFYATLLAARSEAIKRRANATIAPTNSATWTGGWTLKVGGNTFQTVSALRSDVSALPASPASIVYGYNGRVTSGTQSVVFYSTTQTRIDARCVSVDANGLPRVRVDSNKNAADGCN